MAKKKKPEGAPSRQPIDEDPVVKGLLKAISLKRTPPGTKLVADQLVEAFGSNRIHIRQVFQYLGSRNIIRFYPNRGAYVARPTEREARQIFATRRILERAAVVEAIDRLDARSTKVLQRHIAREREHAKDDRWNTLTTTAEFHNLVARLTGNAVLARFIDELVLRTSLIIATFESHSADDCSPDAHPQIAELILARDRQAALDAMDGHLRAMEGRLRFQGPQDQVQDLASIFADLGVTAPTGRKTAK